MVWSLVKISGTLISNASQWHLVKIGGSTAKPNQWHLVRIGGTTVPPNRWHLVRVSGSIVRWHLVKISGQVAVSASPVVGAQTIAADPVAPLTITAATTNGVTPDSWAFSVFPAIPFVQTGASITLSPPGSLSGATLTVTVTATKGANTSPPATITVNVAPANVWSVDAQGKMHAHSSRYSVKG